MRTLYHYDVSMWDEGLPFESLAKIRCPVTSTTSSKTLRDTLPGASRLLDRDACRSKAPQVSPMP